MLIPSSGELRYGPGVRAAVWLDPEIAKYYLRLVPKYYEFKPQMYPTHVTVVRIGKEDPPDMAAWGKHEGEIVPVQYENVVQIGPDYCWLEAYSDRIGEIREELGLPRLRGHFLCYHITIGNRKP